MEHEQVKYAVKRLSRGLSSSRDNAREGFSICLSLLYDSLASRVGESHSVDKSASVSTTENQAETTPSTVQKLLELVINANERTREERDSVFGRLFGIQALVSSQLIKHASTDDIKTMANELLQMKKEYLKVSVCFVFIDLVTKANELGLREAVTYCIEQYTKEQDSIEGVWFAIELAHVEYPWASTWTSWKKGNVLYPKNKSKLIKVLKEATYIDAKLHPVYSSIVKNCQEWDVVEFWNEMAQVFFAQSHDRKAMGFQLFQVMCLSVDVSRLMHPMFMRCLINSLSNKDTYLYKQAQQTVKMFVEGGLGSGGTSVLMALLKTNVRFDSLTKTKTIEGILGKLSSEDVEKHVDYLIQVYENPELVQGGKEGTMLWCVDQVYLLIRTGKIKKENWVSKAMEFFVQVASDENDQVSAMAKEKIVSSLGYLEPQWSSFTLNTLIKTHRDGEFAADLKKVEDLIAKMEARPADKELDAVKSVVVIVGVLIAVSGEHADVIVDLEQVYESMFNTVTSKKRKQEEEVDPVAVLCDILISFLSKPSVVLRGIAMNVVKVFSGRVSAGVVDLLFDVLNAGNEQDLFEEEGEDVEMGSSDSDSSEDEDDQEMEEKENTEVVDEELKRKIQEALQNNEETELEDLNDDEMATFDSKLAEIFGHRKQMAKLKKGIFN
jgi:DNA polymerase phi